MTSFIREYDKLERAFIKMGLEPRDTARGGFTLRLPNGVPVSFIRSVDPVKLDKQRKLFVAAGLHWPLDPKPRKPRNTTPPLPTINLAPIETENPMTAPKATTPPDMEIVEVTPAIAEAWLEKNVSNRKLSDTAVTKYAKLMTDGMWHYDGSPIRFDTTGKLIDGQHRMWAIIESDTTQQFIVLRNLDPKAFITIDTGKARSFGDILSIEFPTMRSVHHTASVASLIWRWEQGHRNKNLRPTGNTSAAPAEVLLEWFRPLQEEISDLQRVGHNLSSRLRGLGGSTAGLLVWIFSHIDEDDAEFFIDRLVDGIGLEEGSPILALRNAIQRFSQSSADRRMTMPTELGVALGIKAWNAYRRGETIALLKFRVGGAKPEAFPEAE